jgi:hypothetical protein
LVRIVGIAVRSADGSFEVLCEGSNEGRGEGSIGAIFGELDGGVDETEVGCVVDTGNTAVCVDGTVVGIETLIGGVEGSNIGVMDGIIEESINGSTLGTASGLIITLLGLAIEGAED